MNIQEKGEFEIKVYAYIRLENKGFPLMQIYKDSIVFSIHEALKCEVSIHSNNNLTNLCKSAIRRKRENQTGKP